MQKIKIMNYLYDRAHNADLILRSTVELMDMLNEDNHTKHDFIEMIIRAQYLLNTAESVSDMTNARMTLNQIRDEFSKEFPEEYEEWWVNEK